MQGACDKLRLLVDGDGGATVLDEPGSGSALYESGDFFVLGMTRIARCPPALRR